MEPYASDQEKIWDYFQNEGMDSFERSTGRLEFLVRRVSPGMRALNIGVGNGTLERLAIAKGVDIWSLDPNDRTINHIRQSLALGDKAQIGYCQSIPYPNEHFDVVIMSEVLEHLDESTFSATLSEVRRVLRTGGKFIGTVPAREKLADSLVVCPHCGFRFHRWGHKQSFDAATLSQALSHYFLVESVRERFFIEWDSVSLWKRLQGLIKKFLSWRGIGTYGIARNIYFSAVKTDQVTTTSL